MAVQNPYFVNIILKWPDGRLAHKSEIARVRAYDSYNGTTTWESECGYDDATGGWKPAYMQRIDVFAGRGSPNLYFEVWSTAEQIVYTTPVVPQVPCGETVTIVIGKGISIGDDNWTISGQVTLADGSAAVGVLVAAYDITSGQTAQLGGTAETSAPGGNFVIHYETAEFSNNGGAHASPNLTLVVSDKQSHVLLRYPFGQTVPRNLVLLLTLPDQPMPRDYRVYGTVFNQLGLPVQGVDVEAIHLMWSPEGPKEIPLGSTVQSGADGSYEIKYTLPKETTETGACNTAGQINLIVYAKGDDADGDNIDERPILDTVGVIFDAAKEQQADLFVSLVAASSDSEYKRIYERLSQCFGATEAAWWSSINAFVQRPEYLTFLSKSTGFSEAQIAAVGRAWTIAGEIDGWTKQLLSGGVVTRPELVLQYLRLPQNGAPVPSSPEILFALVRPGLGDSLSKLLQIRPDTLFDTWLDSANKKVVSTAVETNIGAILADWKALLGRILATPGTDPNYWQAQLIHLALPNAPHATREAVAAATFDFPGSLRELCVALVERDDIDFDEDDAQILIFTFDFYDAVGNCFDITRRVVQANLSSHAWATIADLSRVTLSEWYQLVFEHTDVDGDGTLEEQEKRANVPNDVPGATPEERSRIYATRLHAQFTAASPATKFLADLDRATSSLPDTDLSKQASDFLKDNPDFDLQRTNIELYIEGWEGDADKVVPSDDLIAEIKKLQRLYRLTADYATAIALSAKYDSAIAIAQEDEDEFVVANEKALGGMTTARNIHRTATYYANEVSFTVIKYNQNVNATGGATAITAPLDVTALGYKSPLVGYRPDVARTAGPERASRRFPNWITLFGDLTKCACKHCQTVLSPGAYLVELLQFIEKTFGGDLFERRPDIGEIEITCANTNRMLPYIDLVNELLERVVADTEDAEPFFALAVTAENGTVTYLTEDNLEDASTGDTAEYALVVEAFRQHDYVLGDRAIVKRGVAAAPSSEEFIVEDDAWHFRIRPASTTGQFQVWPYAQTSATNDSLEVFPEHYDPRAYGALARAVFPLTLPLALGKEETAIFLRQRNVHRHEILEAFTTATMDAKLRDLSAALAYLNLTADESAAVLGQTPNTERSEYWGFAVPDTAPSTPVTITRPDKPTLSIVDEWYDLMCLVPVFLHRSGLTYQQLLDLLDTQFVHVEVPGDEYLRIVCTQQDLVECNYNQYQIANLDIAALGRISCLLRLWRRLGWSMRELDRYLMEMEGGQIPGDLFRLSLFKRLVDEMKLPVLTVLSWFRPVDTVRSERQPRSHFDEVFLSGSPSQIEYRAFEDLCVHGTTIALEPSGLTQNEDYPSFVRASLKTKSKEFEALWERYIDELTGLDLESLTNLHRNATLCRALGLTVTQLDDLQLLTGTAPLPDGTIATALLTDALIQCHAALREIRRARAMRVPADEANYYLSHRENLGARYLPTPQDSASLLKRLATAAAEIASVIPKAAEPDSEMLAAALAKVMPADKVVEALEIIAGPPAPPVAPAPNPPENYAMRLLQYQADLSAYGRKYTATEAVARSRSFVLRYFAAFVPSGVAPLQPLQALADALPIYDPSFTFAARLAAVWTHLATHLRLQQTIESAITVATEVTGLERDVTELLLRESLTSVFDDERPALEDWKTFVTGGWLLDIDAAVARRSTSLVVPKDGNYRLAATLSRVDVTRLTAVRVDGELVMPESIIEVNDGDTDATNNPRRLEYGSLALKAQSALNVEFTFDVGSNTTAPAAPVLGWYVENADLAAIPEASLVPYAERADLKLRKAAGLVELLGLTKDETRFLVTSIPGAAPLDLDALPLASGEARVAFSTLTNFTDLVALNRTVALKSRSLFELMSLGEPPLLSTLADELDVLQADLETVRQMWPAGSEPSTIAPEFWYALHACRGIAQRLDLRIEQVFDLLRDPDPSASVAATLRNLYRARFTKDTWKDAFKPLRDALRQKQRDALVGYLTSRPVGADGDLEFFDANDLYGYYLLDVEMEPDTLISRLKLALNSVQLFVERIFLGLEPDTAQIELGKARERWAWMRSYRVWEANRKVFLYPENWIEPELRDDKSEFFREFEEELLAEEISPERGKVALGNYLEKLAEVSNLEIVGAYSQSVQNDPYTSILHVVGRTRYQPRTYYYRSFQGKKIHDGDWTPWRKITIDINADVVAPAIFNGRLYLFWLMVQTKQKPQIFPTDADKTKPEPERSEATGKNVYEERAEYQSEIRLMWSEYLAAERKWLKPRVSKDRLMDSEVAKPSSREIGKETAETKCYHLRIDEAGNESIAISLIKTKEPDASGKLSPRLLGCFALRFNGHDSFDGNTEDLALGGNWPIGTVLRHNGAEEFPKLVEGVTGNEYLQFQGAAPFLRRTPESIRVYQTNFGYLDKAQYKPFFWETPTKSYFALNYGEIYQGATTREALQRVRFSTFGNPQIREIQSRFQVGGPTSIMDRLVQALPVSESYYYNYYNFRSNYYYNYYGNLYLGYHIAGDSMAFGTTQRKFEIEYLPRSDSFSGRYPLPTVEFGYGTPFGLYNWELFFHAPLLVADRLSQDLKFEEAMHWFHYIFDPQQELNSYEKTKRWVLDLPEGCHYWNFLPFFANKSAHDTLSDALGLRKTLSAYDREQLTALIAEWRNQPFNPHLIARQRIVAYQKNVVMRYLDNLIAWGDQEFRQDTFESINRATQLYILAAQLLGKRPEEVEPPMREPRYTYNELKVRKFDAFGDAMVEVEYMVAGNREHVKSVTLAPQTAGAIHVKNLGMQTAYFKVPRNERLDAYWATVADRLFKIRNSMNIDGIKRQLALFEPPIDPALLVRAAAAGLDLSGVLAQLNTPLPYYRFNVWIQKAMDLCNEVKSFGGAILSALEKKDGEALQLLRQGHEVRMLELAKRVRERQIAEAEQNLVALDSSRLMAEERKTFYMTREKSSGTEKYQLRQTELAGYFELAQGVIHSVAALLSPLPDGDFGIVGIFPQATSKFKIGTAIQSAMNSAAAVVGTIAGYHRSEAAKAGINAGFERRWDDWQFQLNLATKEIDQIEQQILAAKIRLQIAELELSNHEVQMEHAEEVREFLTDKFTNRELYQEMVRQLSSTYKSVYKLAYDVAKTAERTFQFELGTDAPGFLKDNYMGNLKMGLLAGEHLVQDLKRMDIAFLEANKREFEIQKSISLASINGKALQDLRDTGVCFFDLPELLFDLDFPGQYFRRIKAVRITIPCVTGPHTSVSAKLTLLTSAIRKQSAANENDYLYTGYDDGRFVHDLVGIQSIATSTAQSDPGLFELNFRDERYLPFEGSGVISRWRLELPTAFRQFDYGTISDVVIHISYTARDGGGTLKTGAEAAILAALNSITKQIADDNPDGLVRVFSLKKEFPDVFHQLLATPESASAPATATLSLLPEHFPYVLQHARMELGTDGRIGVYVHTKPGAATVNMRISLRIGDDESTEVSFSGAPPAPNSFVTNASEILPGWTSQDWTLRQHALSSNLQRDVDDILLVLRYVAALPSN